MNMLDDKGRLFGKVNIIDVLVAVLLVVAVILVGIKLTGKDNGSTGGGTTVTYQVQVRGVTQSAYDALKSHVEREGGDQLMANGEVLDGYVTSVSLIPHNNSAKIFNTESGDKLEIMLDANTVDLIFTVNARIPDAVTTAVGTQEVRIGKGHILKTTHFEFSNGLIIDCQWNTEGDG